MTRQSLSRFLSERSELRIFMTRLLNLTFADSPAEEGRNLVAADFAVNSEKSERFCRNFADQSVLELR